MLGTLACPNCGAELRVRSDAERTTCGSCGREYAVARRGGDTVLKPVIAGEARAVGASGESTQAEAARLRREIGELRRLMDRGEAEGRRSLRSRYNLARLGTSLLAIGLAFRFLLRQQSLMVLVVTLVGAVILVAAISSIKRLTDAHRAGRKLRQEALEAKERELERLRDVMG